MTSDRLSKGIKEFLLSKEPDYFYVGASFLLVLVLVTRMVRSMLEGWSAIYDITFNAYGVVVYAVAAVLFFRRVVPKRIAALKDNIIPFLSFVSPAAMIFLGGYVPLVASFPIVSILLYITGCGLAVASFLSLGKGFGVLPAIRRVATGGPYRYIRHPAYLGEGLYAIGIMLFRVNWMTGFILVVTIVLGLMRILIEERVLSRSPEYRRYRKSTRYRLIPGLW